MNRTIQTNAAVLTLAAALLAGCGDGPAGLEDAGAVRAVVTDDPNEAAAVLVPGDATTSQASSAFSGTLSAVAQVSIYSEGEGWVSLGQPNQIAVSLQSTGDSTEVHGTAEVPVGTYTRVRMELSDADAAISGSFAGISLTATLRVGGSDGSVVIEKEVTPFTITADTRTTVLVDMNSSGWESQDNAEDEQVEDEEVEDSSSASTYSEDREVQDA